MFFLIYFVVESKFLIDRLRNNGCTHHIWMDAVKPKTFWMISCCGMNIDHINA